MKGKRNTQPNRVLPLALIGAGLILVIGVLIWAAIQAQPPSSNVTTNPGASNPSSGEFSYPNIKRVSLEQAKSAFDAKEAVFVDVRSVDSYNAGHIPGSINLPLSQIEAGTADLSQLKKDQWIITYCT